LVVVVAAFPDLPSFALDVEVEPLVAELELELERHMAASVVVAGLVVEVEVVE
jgi:hypothetical protein